MKAYGAMNEAKAFIGQAALSLFMGRDQKGYCAYCARLELVPRSFPENLEAVGRQMNEKWLIHWELGMGGRSQSLCRWCG